MLYQLSVIKIQHFPFSSVVFTERWPGLCGVQGGEEVGVGGGSVPSPRAVMSCPVIITEVAPAAAIHGFHLPTAHLSSSAQNLHK